MGPSALCLLAALPLAAQQPPPAPTPVLHPEVVIVGERDPVPVAAFGLGAGGIDERHEPGPLVWSDGGCLTPGGVHIECRTEGVKLGFPSGCELLLAPDGFLHLRSGEQAGPFAAGVELRLGDGAAVRVTLAQAQRQRLRDVVVVVEDRALQPWRRGGPAHDTPRHTAWAGPRLVCAGDGGDLFSPIALGPLVVLERVLVAKAREEQVPAERLALIAAPLVQSMERLPRQHGTPDPAVRRAATAVAAVADRGDEVFVAGAGLLRAEPDRLRWLLGAGHELQLDLEGQGAPRLALFAGPSTQPMVEWTLLMSPAAFLPNPGDDQAGEKRWYGNGVRLVPVAADLQARLELHERARALAVVKRMR